MLRFNKILDVTTKTRYTIQRVSVMDAGTDECPEATFEADLLGDNDELLCDVVICTSGDASVCINRNLGRDGCVDTIEGIVEGKTLIIATRPAEDDDEDEPQFCVSWDDHEGNEHKRRFRTPQDAISEATYLNKKYDAVAVIGPDGDQLY